ncbi:MAG TPA: hypothetical protein VF250_08170 [Conexibacter sp.]
MAKPAVAGEEESASAFAMARRRYAPGASGPLGRWPPNGIALAPARPSRENVKRRTQRLQRLVLRNARVGLTHARAADAAPECLPLDGEGNRGRTGELDMDRRAVNRAVHMPVFGYISRVAACDREAGGPQRECRQNWGDRRRAAGRREKLRRWRRHVLECAHVSDCSRVAVAIDDARIAGEVGRRLLRYGRVRASTVDQRRVGQQREVAVGRIAEERVNVEVVGTDVDRAARSPAADRIPVRAPLLGRVEVSSGRW